MGNYARLGGCSTKMAGKQRGGEGTGRENTEEVRDVTSARRDVWAPFWKGRWGGGGGEVYGSGGLGGMGRVVDKRWGAWNQQVSACPGLAKPLRFAVWIQARILESSWLNVAGPSWWRELRHRVKYIGQDGRGKRKNCPVNYSGLPGTWLAAAERMGGAEWGWWWGGGWQLYTAGCCSAVEWDCV